MCGITAKASTGGNKQQILSAQPAFEELCGGLSLDRQPAVSSAAVTGKARRSQELDPPRPSSSSADVSFCPVMKQSCERSG